MNDINLGKTGNRYRKKKKTGQIWINVYQCYWITNLSNRFIFVTYFHTSAHETLVSNFTRWLCHSERLPVDDDKRRRAASIRICAM